ncbi:hypothetical protein ACX80Z_00185 [Arthrobacter sp. TMT4-20]
MSLQAQREIWLRFPPDPDIDSLQLTRPEITGRPSPETLSAQLGDIVSGQKPGRESDDERILCWHRGLSILDVAVAHLTLTKAEHADTGTMLRYR